MPRVTPEDMSHTLLPWNVSASNPTRILTSDARCVAQLEGAWFPHNEVEANAAFIVRAANSHEDLVKVLSNVKPLVEWARDHIDPMFAKKAQANVDQIERALAKALGQEER